MQVVVKDRIGGDLAIYRVLTYRIFESGDRHVSL